MPALNISIPPKMGFTFEEDDSANKDLLQLEALILS
jgi:hypothetical protein